MSIIWETQKAVYSKLTTDTNLMSMVTGVFDYVPEGQKYPYVTIGNFLAQDESALGQDCYIVEANIGVYSRSKGRKEIINIQNAIKELLDKQSLVISGAVHINTRFVEQRSALLEDGITFKGGMDFRLRTRLT